jgi:hypothetical protein
VLTSTLSADSFKPAFLIDGFFSNFEKKLIYSIETVYGSNIVAPVSILASPGGFEDPSFFLGSDLYLGYRIPLKKTEWIPLLRWSILFPDTDIMDAFQIELLWGNRLTLSKDMIVNLDFGFVHFSNYFFDGGEAALEPLIELSLRVRL